MGDERQTIGDERPTTNGGSHQLSAISPQLASIAEGEIGLCCSLTRR